MFTTKYHILDHFCSVFAKFHNIFPLHAAPYRHLNMAAEIVKPDLKIVEGD